MQVTAVGELAAIEDNKTQIGNVKNHRLRFRIVRVLNELEGHDVIALKSRQVASDVSKQVRGVRAASAGLGLLIHSCSEPFPLLGSCISSDWSWSVRRPKLVVVPRRVPEVIEQRQFGFVLGRVGLGAEPASDPVAPPLELIHVDAEVVPIDVQEAVPLGGHPPLALQPSGSACCSVAQLGLAPFRSFVVATHLLGADAADVEVLVQIRVFHDVDVADLLVAAHLAGCVIGFVRRLAVGPQVDHIHAVPSFVGHPRLIPSISAHD